VVQPGGLFAPTLFMGAMMGGAVGMFERQMVPTLLFQWVPTRSSYGHAVRGHPARTDDVRLHDPGVSGNYSIIVPVILSNSIAYFISRTFQRNSRVRSPVEAGWTGLAVA